MKRYSWLILFMIALSALFAFADDEAIKDRMLQRLPVLNDLKDSGILGENNKGLLEYRVQSSEKAEMVKAENEDRLKVYASIAQKTGVTAEVVGQRRAIQIAEKAPSGHWLQKPDGTWYKKP
ncbi:MAG TPA: YdbL family protein [Thermoanaerobaculia bacterium]|nr:YdbL family protein [Thermoanaerobaculia bacterium]HUM29998.1 YdbL family protein [Thermoanaerobaculia bacterium]HXK68313.1 YdbL family protein [Thermoanaerobaculia bacterium]